MKVLVLNGPNLARLGTREPDVYGATTWPQLVEQIQEYAASKGMVADVRQTDSEAELMGWLHEAADEAAAGGPEPGGVHALQLRACGMRRRNCGHR